MDVTLPHVVGRTCRRVTTIRHHYRDQPDSGRGPIQFDWDDGSVTTVDSRSDLTVVLSEEPWLDPYASVSGRERDALEAEVGLWVPRQVEPGQPLHAVVGRVASGIRPLEDPTGLLIGVRLEFDELVVVAQIVDLDDWDLEVTVDSPPGGAGPISART